MARPNLQWFEVEYRDPESRQLKTTYVYASSAAEAERILNSGLAEWDVTGLGESVKARVTNADEDLQPPAGASTFNQPPRPTWDGKKWNILWDGQEWVAEDDEILAFGFDADGPKDGTGVNVGTTGDGTTGDGTTPFGTALPQEVAASMYPGQVFQQYLRQQPGYAGYTSGPLAGFTEGLGNIGGSAFGTAAAIQALDPNVALGIGGWDPSREELGFRGYLQRQGAAGAEPGMGAFGVPGFAQNVLSTLAGLGSGAGGLGAVDPDLLALADPASAAGQTDLQNLAYGAALQNYTPLVARTMASQNMREAMRRQWQRTLLGGGARPSFAGFLAQRAGMSPGTISEWPVQYETTLS